MLTPVAMVTVHTECLDSVAPGIDATAFSTIMAPHVLLPVTAAAPCTCAPLPYEAAPLPNTLPLANDELLPYPLPYAELSPPGGPLN